MVTAVVAAIVPSGVAAAVLIVLVVVIIARSAMVSTLGRTIVSCRAAITSLLAVSLSIGGTRAIGSALSTKPSLSAIALVLILLWRCSVLVLLLRLTITVMALCLMSLILGRAIAVLARGWGGVVAAARG